MPAMVGYLNHWATAARNSDGKRENDEIRNLIKSLRKIDDQLTVDVKRTSLQGHFPDKVPTIAVVQTGELGTALRTLLLERLLPQIEEKTIVNGEDRV
ncbi:hypothetical protein TNCV_4158651 [Trichonephila clavipes]|nr:hypothetical protein TNCV_4158651 [Trichonephila clavipes]